MVDLNDTAKPVTERQRCRQPSWRAHTENRTTENSSVAEIAATTVAWVQGEPKLDLMCLDRVDKLAVKNVGNSFERESSEQNGFSN